MARRQTLLSVLTARMGARKGARVAAFLVAWDMAQRSLGDEWPETITEQMKAYSEWWKQPERTGWWELARMREALPEAAEMSPSDFIASLGQWERNRGVLGLGAVGLPA